MIHIAKAPYEYMHIYRLNILASMLHFSFKTIFSVLKPVKYLVSNNKNNKLKDILAKFSFK